MVSREAIEYVREEDVSGFGKGRFFLEKYEQVLDQPDRIKP